MSTLPPSEFFALNRPCGNCPFRTDTPPFPLRTERKKQIADSLREGWAFVCHRTVNYSDRDDESQGQDGARMCAGARATLAAEGPGCESKMISSEQVARRLHRLGFFPDPVPELADDLPVHASLDDWIGT